MKLYDEDYYYSLTQINNEYYNEEITAKEWQNRINELQDNCEDEIK